MTPNKDKSMKPKVSECSSKSAKHKWMESNYGKPKVCESKNCEGKSKWFDWCIKTGREYSHNREDYLRLCRSCHRKYDLTEIKKKQAIKNLWWKRGVVNPARGEGNGRSHLTVEKVLFVREQCKMFGKSYAEAARMVGATRGAVTHAVKYSTWRHVK